MNKEPNGLESELYQPVKDYLTSIGFSVRGEVGKCDVVGVNGDRMVVVELKRTFSLSLLYQAAARLKLSPEVFVAIPFPDMQPKRGKVFRQLESMTQVCAAMGIGLLSVGSQGVFVHCLPRTGKATNPRAKRKLLREFGGRSGDHNVGGTTSRERVTAYREAALKCLKSLVDNGQARPARIKAETGVEKAGGILHRNVYGWFNRVGHGVYAATDKGTEALLRYGHVVNAMAV